VPIYPPGVAVFRTPRGNQATMHYRQNSSDWNTLVSAMTADEYELGSQSFAGHALDIGAHIGGVAIALALDNPGLSVTAVEPVPDNVRLLRANVDANGLSGLVNVVEGAAGHGRVTVWYGRTGSETLEHHAFIGNNSLAYDSGGGNDPESVTYRGLTLRELSDGRPVDLLKIDNEGGEYDFLADSAVVRCRVILGEWHNVRGHVQGDVADLLRETHRVTFTGPVAGPGGFTAVLL